MSSALSAQTVRNMTISPDTETGLSAPHPASIVLIGFRGVGKSTLGLILATHLDRPFIDADRALSSVAQCSPNEFIRKHSWEAFRDLETEILSRILRDHPSGYVIACGGGVIERRHNRQILQNFGRAGGIVVHITREKEEVIRYLINEKDRPQWGEEIRSVWARRFPLFEECSTHTYVTLTAKTRPRAPSLMLKHVEQDWLRYIRLLLRSAPPPIDLHGRTYTLAIDCAVPQELTHEVLAHASGGVTALDLRVDSLRRPANLYQTSIDTPVAKAGAPDPSFIAFAVAHLRRISKLPIIYSLRTIQQGGSFTAEHSTPGDYARLARTAYKCGVEFIELGLDVGAGTIRAVLAQKPAYIRCILSYYDVQGQNTWSSPEVLAKYREAAALGADIVKLVLVARTIDDNLALHRFQQKLRGENGGLTPLLAYNTGHMGKMSSLFNYLFTPVTHRSLPFPVPPGTATFSETQQALSACGLVQRSRLLCARVEKNGFTMLQRAVASLCLPITIADDGWDTDDASVLGAIGHFETQDVVTKADCSTGSRWIGFSDTVSRQTLSDRIWHENAHALALSACIARVLSPINAVTPKSVAVLLGARGRAGKAAAYALLDLGLRHILCSDCDDDILAEDAFEILGNGAVSMRIPPTVIVACSLLPDMAQYRSLLSSPTGGAFVNLAEQSIGIASLNVADSRRKECWIELSRDEINQERIARQFELITGHSLPQQHY